MPLQQNVQQQSSQEQAAQPPIQRPSQQPLYILKQSKIRAILPKTITLLILAIIFYLGIMLNISLLELTGEEETLIQGIALVVLLVVILIGIVLTIIRSGRPYNFYRSRITFRKKEIPYAIITNTNSRQNLIDKIFKTYSIKITDKFQIKNISQKTYKPVQIQQYLQKMVNYAKSQQATTY